MPIQVFHFNIVDEHHGIAYVRMYQQRFLVCVEFHADSYYLSDIVHFEEAYCTNCAKNVTENTPCLHFSFHDEDVQKLERNIEHYIKIHFLKEKALSIKNKKSEEVRDNQNNIIQLNLIAINRGERIESYGSNFRYYMTRKDGKSLYVNLNLKEQKRKPKQTLLYERTLIENFMAESLPTWDKVKEAEEYLTQYYDVSITKWNKLMQLLEALKSSILMYTPLYEQYKHASFQELIIFLHEIVYRELPMRFANDHDLIKKHEQMSGIIQLYILNQISYNDCINQLVKDPHDYLKERKERVVYAIKALFKAKEVYRNLKKIRVEEADNWQTDLCTMLVTYIQFELGIMFYPKDIQNQKEDFLLHQFTLFEQGVIQEKTLYYKINGELPFIEETFYEKINRYLQKVNEEKPKQVFYLMEIELKEDLYTSLASHEAYKRFDKIEVEVCNLFDGNHHGVLNWMTEEQFFTFRELLKGFETEKGQMKIWKVNNTFYPKMDEYIIYNGEGLYRLHFRKDTI